MTPDAPEDRQVQIRTLIRHLGIRGLFECALEATGWERNRVMGWWIHREHGMEAISWLSAVQKQEQWEQTHPRRMGTATPGTGPRPKKR